MEFTVWRVLASATVLVGLSAIGPSFAAGYTQTNLVSDLPGAAIVDPSLVNPWGMAASTASPIWVSDNGTGLATLYSVDPATNVPAKAGLTVSIPGDGSVTGQVYANVAGNFNNDTFLFVNEDGTVSGWRAALGTTAEILATGSASNVYKGAAMASIGGNAYLYAANFRTGSIDVYKGNAAAPSLAGNFTDPNLPSGYAPFNIQNLGGQLYVTYALQDAAKHDDVPGAGHGFVTRFDLNGVLLGRVISNGVLNSPWGLALAPANFGDFSNALLVGNFGDGTINAFNPSDGSSLGTIRNSGGVRIVVNGLWGLRFGNGSSGGAGNALFFTAGIPGSGAIGDHGLFGNFTPFAATPPILLGAVSRRLHAAAGTFDLPLSLVPSGVNHSPGTEPRQGPSHTIVFAFNKPVTAATATITEGSGTAGAPTFSGNDVIVGLSGIADAQYVTVTLGNVASSDGGIGGTGSVRVGFLFGDGNESRQVTVADVGIVNASILNALTNTNFLLDINVDGKITVADKGLANASLLKKLPVP